MSNMIILRPLPVAAYSGSYTSIENAFTPDPKEVAVGFHGGSSEYVDIDLGAVVSVDTFFQGFTNALPTAVWAIQVRETMGGTITSTVLNNTLIRSPDGIGPRYHALHKTAAPVLARYLRIWFAQAATSADPAPRLGVLAVGLAFRPTYNREWGGGRRIIDTGARESLLGGGFGIGEGAIKAAYQWTFGDLSDAETDALYALALARGETRPVIVVEDPDKTAGLMERIHYGLFTRFESFERRSQDKTRWSLTLEQWV